MVASYYPWICNPMDKPEVSLHHSYQTPPDKVSVLISSLKNFIILNIILLLMILKKNYGFLHLDTYIQAYQTISEKWMSKSKFVFPLFIRPINFLKLKQLVKTQAYHFQLFINNSILTLIVITINLHLGKLLYCKVYVFITETQSIKFSFIPLKNFGIFTHDISYWTILWDVWCPWPNNEKTVEDKSLLVWLGKDIICDWKNYGTIKCGR